MKKAFFWKQLFLIKAKALNYKRPVNMTKEVADLLTISSKNLQNLRIQFIE